jgi:hypothetical protein
VAREKLMGEKLRRDSFQIGVLWRLLQEQKPDTPQHAADLGKLINLTSTIERRSTEAGREKAMEWCASILAAADGLKMNVERSASMHLLGHAALSLHQLICPEKTPADQLNEIDATVAIIRARNQATALAS